MSEDTENVSAFTPPVSAFRGPVGELIAQRMVTPPSRPGLLASLDQFEILRLLGGGGMGVVLLARDSVSGREVAVKMVKSDLLGNPSIVHRFLKEAGHLKRLRHTNVVPVLEISNRAEGPYFVMPYFERGSLAGRIKPGQPMNAEVILDVAAQVAEGLSFAHRSGIIHRDLKPANILLAADGRVCLADFGLARTVFNDSVMDVGSRDLEGTAPYMSPAVAAGDAEDTRCDIYSFGAVVYEMLTGWPPYQGRGTKEILDQIIAGPPRSITSLNPNADRGLAAVAQGCLARELRDRYADMRDVLQDLQRLREDKAPLGRRGARGGTPGLPKVLWVSGGLAVTALAAWMFWPAHGPAPVAAVAVAPVAALPKPLPVTTPAPAPAPTPVEPPRPLEPEVSTLAGQAGVGGYDDGPANQALFRLPNSVAADSAGNLYVADTANDTIRKISPDGTVSALAGVPESHGSTDGPGDAARFWGPSGVAVDQAGNVYVADSGNNTIRKITPAGMVGTLAGLAGHPGGNDGIGAQARFRNPWGVAVDPGGNVLVADLSNHTIRKITPAGVVTTVAGVAGQTGGADGPADEARFNGPSAVAVDAAGNIFVANSGGDTIREIATNGLTSTLAGLPGHADSTDGDANNARFSNPGGLAVDGRGNIYVADAGNNTIRKISPAGGVTTLAGRAGTTGSTDGAGPAARFNNPGGVAVDRAGNVYVADTDNHTIRKLSGPVPP
jgi:hypothetical protein